MFTEDEKENFLDTRNPGMYFQSIVNRFFRPSKKLADENIMFKSTLAIFVVFAIFLFSGVTSPNACSADTCLACHGNADQLKSMINDEDFNKPPGGEGYG